MGAQLAHSGSAKKLKGERQKALEAIDRVFDKFRGAWTCVATNKQLAPSA